MPAKPRDVSEYLASLPAERRDAIAAMRALVRRSLPEGFEEGIQYGMISWFVPLARVPHTYNGQPLTIASLAAQKSHNALYLMGAYAIPEEAARLAKGFAAAGKRLDMGKSCLRWKTIDDLALAPLERALEAVTVEALVAHHDAVHGQKKAAPKKAATKSAARKQAATTSAAPKKAAPKKAAPKKAAPKKAVTKKAATKPR